MQVKTQPFKEALEIKSDGISFDVYGNGSKRLGDLSVTRGGLVWSKGPNGRASRSSGINVKWEEFINWVQSRRAGTKASASGVPSLQGAAALRSSAQPQRSASSGKQVSQAGKLAARRASAMKLSAAAKSAKSSSHGSASSRLSPQSSASGKSSVSRLAQSKGKSKAPARKPLSAARRASGSAARRKAS